MSVKEWKTERGFGIVELLIGLGVMSLVMMLGFRLLNNSQALTAKIYNRMNLHSVAQTLEAQIDCAALTAACSSGTNIALPNKKGGVLVGASASTVMRGWTLRAVCEDHNQFSVQVALKGQGQQDFFKDPLTGEVLDFNHPKSILFQKGALCPPESVPESQANISTIVVKSNDGCVVSDPADLPCNAPQPPDCDPGFTSIGITLDTFGGTHPTITWAMGQRFLRYCTPSVSP